MQETIQTVLHLLTYDPKAPLIFSSGLFLFLFLGFSLIFSFMSKRTMLRIVYVTLFSLYFYYKSSGLYVGLLLLVATLDYGFARAMALDRFKKCRGWVLATSLVVNLGMLCYFKYTNFFIDIANTVWGKDFLEFRNIFLPIGISFFLFQSMSYTIDVYRKKITPLTHWIDYLFFVSFFPVLVAGPIIRAHDFIPQIRQNPLKVTKEMFGTAIFLIASGLFKKCVISDYISLNFVDRIFDNPLLYSGFENLMGLYGYALQIYCDFSGYSDMALGIALLLGFRFHKNFDSPYKSATITEFWRRWHISLSSWLKDYLYISLGGNRKGRFRQYINLLLTMLLGGLWHGAAFRFILWGGLHGTALAIHKFVMSRFSSFKAIGAEMSPLRRVVGILFTFHLVCLSWIFFRADSITIGKQMLIQIFTNFNLALAPNVVWGYLAIFVLFLVGYVLHFTPEKWELKTQKFVINTHFMVKAIILIVIIWFVMQIKSAEIQPFIYFQF
ncbi:MAG: MBOAT family protein [Prevotellaceae bacterium]|jgi:D-alanyl-lipoteichoic acid acyltransferase DltB (MBOAT superfamily)|nr:MBOAT family protein [Prevotellaceae bacterium]